MLVYGAVNFDKQEVAMTGKEMILGRRSIRKYSDKPVDDAVLQEIVEEASYAPSWKHSQITRYIAVKDPALKERIASDRRRFSSLSASLRTAQVLNATAPSPPLGKTVGNSSMQAWHHRHSALPLMNTDLAALSWDFLTSIPYLR